MIGPIQIDLSELQAEFNLKQVQVEELSVVLVNQITDRIFNNWRVAAMNGLNSTRKQYIQNLNIGHISPTKKYIQLTGSFPNMLENGFGAYDMKPGFLASNKVKTTKNGIRYLIIPFRWGTPGSIGESEVFANKMPDDVYNTVKRLRPTKTHYQLGVIQRGKGIRKNQLPTNLRKPLTRPQFTDAKSGTTYPAYTHKGPIHEGIVRNEKTYENSTQSSYVSFRRVSEKSDPMSWIHKGVAAKNFAQQALNKTDVGNITDRTIDTFLQQLGF